MGMCIQPPEIVVTKENPFENDLLNRKDAVEVLTQLVGSFDGPCVLAVDAPWGMGKTTFIKMWSQHMRNQNFPVVMFNAWENDFSGSPFVSLTAELTKGLSEYGEPVKPKVNKVKKLAKLVLSFVRVGGAGLSSLADATVGAEGVVAATGASFSEQVASQVDKGLENYWSAKESEVSFKDSLQDLANTLSESREKRSLVVIIDELDRCRPTYAIELLEVAKHLFSVDGIVFVLAINRAQLASSLKGLYGNEFDGEGYLRRFIDLDFRLPEPQRDEFITALLERIQFADVGSVGRKLLQHFFRTSSLTIRQIEQATLRLGLVLASLPNGGWPATAAAIALLILRTTDKEIYYQFINRDTSITDDDVIDAVFESLNLKRESSDTDGVNIAALFESIIITGHQEKKLIRNEIIDSELLNGYKDLAEIRDQNNLTIKYARDVASYVGNIITTCNQTHEYIMKGGYGFQECIECLELLPPDLLNEPEIIATS